MLFISTTQQLFIDLVETLLSAEPTIFTLSQNYAFTIGLCTQKQSLHKSYQLSNIKNMYTVTTAFSMTFTSTWVIQCQYKQHFHLSKSLLILLDPAPWSRPALLFILAWQVLLGYKSPASKALLYFSNADPSPTETLLKFKCQRTKGAAFFLLDRGEGKGFMGT